MFIIITSHKTCFKSACRCTISWCILWASSSCTWLFIYKFLIQGVMIECDWWSMPISVVYFLIQRGATCLLLPHNQLACLHASLLLLGLVILDWRRILGCVRTHHRWRFEVLLSKGSSSRRLGLLLQQMLHIISIRLYRFGSLTNCAYLVVIWGWYRCILLHARTCLILPLFLRGVGWLLGLIWDLKIGVVESGAVHEVVFGCLQYNLVHHEVTTLTRVHTLIQILNLPRMLTASFTHKVTHIVCCEVHLILLVLITLITLIQHGLVI